MHVENCGYCGRFTTKPDVYSPWGGAADLEPPDPVYLCEPCASQQYQRTLANILDRGLAPYEQRGAWVESAAVRRARSVARAMWKHGVSERPVIHTRARYEMTGTRHVWWCACGRPERHPVHDWDEARRLSVQWHPFERRVGRNIGTTKVQEWCACGWTTGPLVPGPDRQVDYLGGGWLIREHVESHRNMRVCAEALDPWGFASLKAAPR